MFPGFGKAPTHAPRSRATASGNGFLIRGGCMAFTDTIKKKVSVSYVQSVCGM
jgi:hypothetical protein